MNNANTIGYKTTLAGANVSANYNKQTSGGSSYSIGADIAPADGVMLFAAMADKYAGVNATTDEMTFGATYTTGATTVGIQRSSIDKTAVDTDQDRTHVGVSFAVNEDLSVSWGMSTVEFEAASKVDQEDSGFSVSYTMGSLSMSLSMHQVDNINNVATNDREAYNVSLGFAF